MLPREKCTSHIDATTTPIAPPEPPHRLECQADGEWACDCDQCNPIVNLTSVRQEQQIARLDQELLAHEQLLWDLSAQAAAMAVRFDSGLLTSAAFNIVAARGRLVAALNALDRIEVAL